MSVNEQIRCIREKLFSANFNIVFANKLFLKHKLNNDSICDVYTSCTVERIEDLAFCQTSLEFISFQSTSKLQYIRDSPFSICKRLGSLESGLFCGRNCHVNFRFVARLCERQRCLWRGFFDFSSVFFVLKYTLQCKV